MIQITALKKNLLIALWLVATTAAYGRTFTSTDGRTLEAELVRADVSNAVVKLQDGRETSVALSRLSQPDQDYVSDWIKSHPMEVHYSFAVEWSRDKLKSNHKKVGHINVTENQYIFHFKVTNRASVPLDKVDVHMQVYYKTQDQKYDVGQHADSKRTIPEIKAGQTVNIDSDPLTLDVTDLQGGWHYRDGSNSHNQDNVKGVAVTVYHNGKQVFEYVTNGIKKAGESDSPSSKQ